jgi:hypothetical protein
VFFPDRQILVRSSDSLASSLAKAWSLSAAPLRDVTAGVDLISAPNYLPLLASGFSAAPRRADETWSGLFGKLSKYALWICGIKVMAMERLALRETV